MRGKKLASFTVRIGAKARPRIVRSLRRQAGTYRIQLDVAVAGKQVALGLHKARLVPSVPEAPRSAIRPVDVLRMQLTHVLHEHCAAVSIPRRYEQVDMVGHEAIRVERAARAWQQARQVEEIKRAVLLGEKAVRSVISPLHQV